MTRTRKIEVSCVIALLLLLSGITSPRGEQCIVSGASGVTLQSCLGAIAAGDGREVLQFDQEKI